MVGEEDFPQTIGLGSVFDYLQLTELCQEQQLGLSIAIVGIGSMVI
jgi:hypothetical protein